jgi:invasion protein IalB
MGVQAAWINPSIEAFMSRVRPKTVFERSQRIVLAAGAVFLLTFGILPLSEAGGPQPPRGSWETSIAWSKLCFDAPYVRQIMEGGLSESLAAAQTVEACYTYVSMPAEPAGSMIAALGVLQAQALNRTLLIAVFPLQAVMNTDPGYLLFQDGTRIKLAYLSRNACDKTGCYARAELSEDLLERIKVAKALSFGTEDVRGHLHSIPLDWYGFTEVFRAAPAINDSHIVDRRLTAKVALRRKFLDFIQ